MGFWDYANKTNKNSLWQVAFFVYNVRCQKRLSLFCVRGLWGQIMVLK